jgi:hypothetical protein
MACVTSPIDIVCLFNMIFVVVEVKYHVVYLYVCLAQLQHNRIFVFDGLVSFITDNYN